MSRPIQIVGVLEGLWGPSNSTTSQTLMVVGVLLVTSLLVFIWAAFFRSQRRRHRHHHYHYPEPSEPPAPGTAPKNQHDTKFLARLKRRRIRRREHRSRNPTLAEAGGLPPIRPDEPPPPPT